MENPELYAEKMSTLKSNWDGLKASIEDRKKRLADSERAQQYYHDAAEAEAWMSEQVSPDYRSLNLSGGICRILQFSFN